MIRFTCYSVLVSLAMLALVEPVAAQSAESSVSGMGVVTIERPAERMRMQVELAATAPTLKEALKALKDRQDAAQAQLEALGADKASVKFSDVAVSEGRGSDRRKQMERMLRSRLSGRKAKDNAAEALPTSHTVAVQLVADWPLAAAKPEDTLLAVHEIQGKVRKADLAGLSEKKTLSPEEQELEEEMAEMRNSYGEEEESPGEPRFAFVAQLSDAEREKALAEAFEKAKAQAGRTATAAGAQLGKLLRVRDPSTGSGTSEMMSGYYDDDPYAYGPYASQMRRQLFFAGGASDNEGFAQQPGKVPFRVGINAVFELK